MRLTYLLLFSLACTVGTGDNFVAMGDRALGIEAAQIDSDRMVGEAEAVAVQRVDGGVEFNFVVDGDEATLWVDNPLEDRVGILSIAEIEIPVRLWTLPGDEDALTLRFESQSGNEVATGDLQLRLVDAPERHDEC
ncbi:MAG: hypothetical protein AAGE52_33470 [Myxococcota bacterium]